MTARVALVALVFAGATVSASEPALVRFAAADWRVTRGHVAASAAGGAHVTEPTVRAVAPGSDGSAARLRFVYRGPSATEAKLASGEARRQIGLKLRAQDGCNLVYVMWRLAPIGKIVVSVKRNPGARTHRECGARGYRNLVATAGAQPPPLQAGAAHVLQATLAGSALTVLADGALAWSGDIGADAASLRGPAGWRSDNGEFDVELDAVRGAETGSGEDDD
ncbi:MAG TPA: hypothetical protein VIA18_30940 [Polyangia bacterium]|nr:hypothetical protein [Polyangia bacterium]